MLKTIALGAVALSLVLGAGASVAQDNPDHRMDHRDDRGGYMQNDGHHRHHHHMRQSCTWHHHHRVCRSW